jgi:hypothetical protein
LFAACLVVYLAVVSQGLGAMWVKCVDVVSHFQRGTQFIIMAAGIDVSAPP